MHQLIDQLIKMAPRAELAAAGIRGGSYHNVSNRGILDSFTAKCNIVIPFFFVAGAEQINFFSKILAYLSKLNAFNKSGTSNFVLKYETCVFTFPWGKN
jgi:hypothetical protein